MHSSFRRIRLSICLLIWKDSKRLYHKPENKKSPSLVLNGVGPRYVVDYPAFMSQKQALGAYIVFFGLEKSSIGSRSLPDLISLNVFYDISPFGPKTPFTGGDGWGSTRCC